MKKICLVLSAATLLSSNAFAGDLYGFADAGQSKISLDVEGSSFSKTDTAVSLGLGYKINSTFSIEGAYRDLGSISDVSEYDDKTSISATAIQVSVIAAAQMGDKFNLYGRLGYARIKAEAAYEDCCDSDYDESDSATKNKAVFGVGGEYKVTESFGVRAEYSKYAKWDDVTLSSVTVGLTYIF